MLNRQPLADDLDWHDFFSVSFTHHCEILAKTDTLEERAFYIHHDADKTNDDKDGWIIQVYLNIGRRIVEL